MKRARFASDRLPSIQGLVVLVPLLLASLLAFALSGCAAGARLTEVWQAPADVKPPLTRIVVHVAKKDPVRQRVWEDEAVARLRKSGVEAFPSYAHLAAAEVDSTRARQWLRDERIDGVLIVQNAGGGLESRFVPGFRWWPHPAGRYPHPGWVGPPRYYARSEAVARYDVSLVRVSPTGSPEADTLIWSARTEAYDPGSAQDAGRSVAREVVAALKKAGLLPVDGS